jgi:hypothetical protein
LCAATAITRKALLLLLLVVVLVQLLLLAPEPRCAGTAEIIKLDAARTLSQLYVSAIGRMAVDMFDRSA